MKKSEAKEKFENIIIDTADIAWDLCEKFVCQREQKAKIGDIPYGAGYAMVEKEFDEKLRQIVQLDYGLFIISHSEEKSIKTLAGEETTKIGPTVNKRAAKVINRMADIIGYVKPITKRNEETGEELTRSYMFMRGNSRFTAGSRFKYIAECIDFSYENLVEAMHDAIDKEAKETGGKYVRDERINLYTEDESGSTFKDVVDQFNLTVENLMSNGVSPAEITKIIENVLGVGKMVKDCTEDQKSFIELINEKLKDLK